MTNKEALDYMYGVAICGSGVGETGNKVRECYNKIADNLEQKELLENELKLEKHKVKYVMKQLKKQDKMLDTMSNYALTFKDDEGVGFVIEMWSDFEGFENVKDWVEKIYQNDKKIERMFDENDK